MKAYFRGWMGAFGALALTMLAAPKARCADAPLNFIIIMCDSLRFDTLECYSSQYPRLRAAKGEAQMPHIDNFARRATIFERCYVGSYPTVPNRKDLFTGKLVFPFEGWSPLSPDAVTFAQELVKAGYWTQMIQDTPHTLNKGFNFQRDFNGWQFIRGQETDNPGPRPLAQPGDPAKTRGTENWSRHLGNLQEYRHYEADSYCAQTMATAARWLERNYDLGPFALYIDTFDPHEPWDSPRWYEDMYWTGEDCEAYRYPIYGKADLYSEAELARMRAMYAAEATLVDRWVGYLLESIERMGLMDNSIIVITGDHGVSTGDHGYTGKNAMPLYEVIAHVPLLIRMPGQTESRRVKELTQHCDLMPTLLDFASVTPRKALDGISLRPALEGKPLPSRPYVFTRGNDGLTVTSEEWSLVYPPSGQQDRASSVPELFHLPSDPTQTKNVLSENLEQARAMWDAYNAWMAEALGAENTQAPKRP
ncbi:MAG: Arylsulfatase [candidate division BRC1 bacterium ADurb.BinA364]|nr:MAG: Arylsulfatase [candidate division BRC1 bacterium ADurb.BinA364]